MTRSYGHHEEIERLICRVLDHEASEQDRRRLDAVIRQDAGARALFQQMVALDDRVGRALRAALEPPGSEPVAPTAGGGRGYVRGWRWVTRLVGVAAAACVVGLLAHVPGERAGAEVQRASWFVPPPAPGDSLVEPDVFASIPAVRLRDADRRWVVVPARRPGEYLVVEVARICERTIPLERDY